PAGGRGARKRLAELLRETREVAPERARRVGRRRPGAAGGDPLQSQMDLVQTENLLAAVRQRVDPARAGPAAREGVEDVFDPQEHDAQRYAVAFEAVDHRPVARRQEERGPATAVNASSIAWK